MIFANWIRNVVAWWQGCLAQGPRPANRRRQWDWDRRGALIGRLEVLEPRLLLTNVIDVDASAGLIRLVDVSRFDVATGDTFDVSYTSSRLVLTGHNGTEFRVGDQTLTEFTADLTEPPRLVMHLSRNANLVNVTGDGTARLDSIYADLWRSQGENSLKLTNVIVGDAVVDGGWSGDAVTLDHTTVNGHLTARLGWDQSDTLKLQNSTVINQNTVVWSQHVTASDTIFHGRVRDVQWGRGSTLDLTATTFDKPVTIVMGRGGVVNLHSSTSGANTFHSVERIIGRRRQPVVVNVGTNTVVNQVAPRLIHAHRHVISSVVAPTVNALAANTLTPTITGTWDSAHAQKLTVAVNGVTYILGQDAKLSSPSAGTWALNLTGTPLPGGASTVTVTNSDTFGNTAQGSGVVTTPNVPPQQLAAIDTFLAANQLTGKRTSSGLSHVITTLGTGVVPTNGKQVTVNYTGRLLNLDGTLGTVFDSNIDPQFNHVQPFQFTLGLGQVIKGWDEAFLLLPVGTVAKLLIPSPLGYGTLGSGANIPPNSILLFDVTLLSVQ